MERIENLDKKENSKKKTVYMFEKEEVHLIKPNPSPLLRHH